MQNLYSKYTMPAESLVSAKNVLIDATGAVTSTAAAPTIYSVVNQVRPSARYNSFYSYQGTTYGVSNGTVSVIRSDGTSSALENPDNIVITGGVDWVVTASGLQFSTSTAVGQVVGNSVRLLASFNTVPTTSSGISDGGAATFGAQKADGGVATSSDGGKGLTTYWRGRMIVGQPDDNRIAVSEPFDPETFDPHYGYFELTKPIFVLNVDTGLYIGGADGVYFVTGDDVPSWEFSKVSDTSGIEGVPSGIVVPSAGIELPSPSNLVAVWFTEFGFTLGLQSGSVIYPQGDRLQGLTALGGSMSYIDGRFTF